MSEEASFEEKLKEFASLFDPPMRVVRKTGISPKGNESYDFLCLCSEDGHHMSFNYKDDVSRHNGCFFHTDDSWDDWMSVLKHGGTWTYVEEIIEWECYKDITFYTMPSFTSLEELAVKLITLGRQEPIAKINDYREKHERQRKEHERKLCEARLARS